MASDAAGNVYAAGRSDNSSGSRSADNAVVREKISGSSNWTTIELDTSAPNFGSVATDANGNLFVAVHTPTSDTGSQWQILERPAGQTAFAVVDQLSALGQCNGLATDAAGDVFACGEVAEPHTLRGQTGFQDHWIVRKWTAGSGGFVTVDDHVDYSTWNSPGGRDAAARPQSTEKFECPPRPYSRGLKNRVGSPRFQVGFGIPDHRARAR